MKYTRPRLVKSKKDFEDYDFAFCKCPFPIPYYNHETGEVGGYAIMFEKRDPYKSFKCMDCGTSGVLYSGVHR